MFDNFCILGIYLSDGVGDDDDDNDVNYDRKLEMIRYFFIFWGCVVV